MPLWLTAVVPEPPSSLARLGPLIPQLALAWQRNRGLPPQELRAAGVPQGARHISLLTSLALAGPAAVSDLAARLDMSLAHASLLVGELARAGLVDREHDPADRRRIVVSLSAQAAPAVAEMRRRHAAPLEEFLVELSSDQAEVFIAQLGRLVQLMIADR